MRAEPAHAGPVVAEAASIFRQQRVVFDRLEDAVQIIRNRGQIAGRELERNVPALKSVGVEHMKSKDERSS